MKIEHQLEGQLGGLWFTSENEEEHQLLARLEARISGCVDCHFEKAEGEDECLFIDLSSFAEAPEEAMSL